ncbi:hypothetical protein VNI00_013889 [Paramarasmius palmivorus]|uniref:Phosphoglycerate mutase-like protein n=1 Tax=Paramarasmius palmivorus TaxID=297713 RepID=A0AAW0BWJ1_9AGAR
MTKVLGTIIIARSGDRTHFWQDPRSYRGDITETSALGVSESYQLGQLVRDIYLNPSSSSYINGMRADVVDNREIKVRVKAGAEGTVNKIELANDTTVTAPLGGYQYVPVETVEPVNDRSLESWTDCPNFEKHVAQFYSSSEFKKKEKEAEPFFRAVKDYVFGRSLTLQNAHNIYDYMQTGLTYNKTYAHRLPPKMIEQARHWANFHENGVFSDEQPSGIGNIAGRTMLHTILTALERVAFNDDPLQFMLVETSYHPFISFFHEVEPTLHSALAIELRRGPAPDLRDFLRFKFKNGTSSDFKTLYVYGHHADIPLTEFIYKSKDGAITSNRQWSEVCGRRRLIGAEMLESPQNRAVFGFALAVVSLLGLFVMTRFVKKIRSARRLRLQGEETHINPIAKPVEKVEIRTV